MQYMTDAERMCNTAKDLSAQSIVVIGAGAAGLMCAIEAAKRGRKVLVLEKSNKAGKKILMSGGGRCNFTNVHTSAEQFISNNRHFVKSALSRYTASNFLALVEQYKIPYFEKTLGQLFCQEKSAHILEMLLHECQKYGVTIQLNETIVAVKKEEGNFIIQTVNASYYAESLVVATGGLSIPTLGSSPFGYQLAAQFGLRVYPLRAGLVPLTLHDKDKERFQCLTGISVDALVKNQGHSFHENILFTHRGLSGPAILQISSYWLPGEEIAITFIPEIDVYQELLQARTQHPKHHLKTLLSHYVAKRLLDILYEPALLTRPLQQFTDKQLREIVHTMQHFSIKPNATEGYRTAEVTLGGVDCDEISSKTFEAKKVLGLFFIGEVLDVSGWLGGYNFQWAWSSGWVAGQVV